LRTSDFDPISVEIFHKQIRLTTLVVVGFFLVLILRLWFLQIACGNIYRTQSENNRIRLQAIPAVRGIVYDAAGEMLVSNRPSYDLYVIPEEVRDRDILQERLNRLIGLSAAKVEEKFDARARRYPFRPVCIKRDMQRDELAVIESHRFNLPGILIRVKPQRHYHLGDFASHLLGHLGEITERQLRSGNYPMNRAGDWIGKSGVEKKWENALRGSCGGEQVEVDAVGRKIRIISRQSPLAGANVYLTIDKALQSLVEGVLGDKRGSIVAVDPRDGAVLALVSSPSFDPNDFINGLDQITWSRMAESSDFPLQNRALAGQYPPGSIFKIVLALAGLEEEVIDPHEELICRGRYRLGNYEYRCWKEGGHGKIGLHRALRESCDVFFYQLGERLGVDRIARYARRFGFGDSTGIDIDHEKKGLIPDREWKLSKYGVPWQGGETLSMSIGQSFVLVTPIQVASFVSAVFNGGKLYRPQLTQWVGKTAGEKIFAFEPELRGNLEIRQEYLNFVRNALVSAVNGVHGTGSKAKLEDIIVAGKTGTAQVIGLKQEEGWTDRNKEIPQRYRDHAWFTAVAPANNPRIALAILIEHGGHGGSVAAPMARKIIKGYLGS
jgi:penicillin-binding protein 2